MSIAYNLDNLGKCLGRGSDRATYELLGTNLVVKRSRHKSESFQSIIEKHLWEKMDAKEKTIMPIVDILIHKNIIHFVMKRCKTIDELYNSDEDTHAMDWEELVEHYGGTLENFHYVNEVVENYDICDDHEENFGMDEDGNYYLLDAGYNRRKHELLQEIGAEEYMDGQSSDYVTCSYCGEPRLYGYLCEYCCS